MEKLKCNYQYVYLYIEWFQKRCWLFFFFAFFFFSNTCWEVSRAVIFTEIAWLNEKFTTNKTAACSVWRAVRHGLIPKNCSRNKTCVGCTYNWRNLSFSLCWVWRSWTRNVSVVFTSLQHQSATQRRFCCSEVVFQRYPTRQEKTFVARRGYSLSLWGLTQLHGKGMEQ